MSTQADVEVVIVGAGMSGLAAAASLQRAGISFAILEATGAIGGTWAANTYPGCACDIPSHLYGFSFAPNPGWSKVWADQPEILAYLESVVDQRGLREHIRFHATLQRATFDAEAATWVVEAAGSTLRARFVIGATGPLRVPKLPQISGLGDFEGPSMHSARWDDRVALDGKRVGIVGSAASAVQIVPRLAPRVARLSVFQRTPNYVIPKPNRRYTPLEQWAMRSVPGYWRLVRGYQFWRHELRFHAAFTPGRPSAKLVEALLRREARRQVTDPVLREKVVPSYRVGCKRVLLESGYYAALGRDSVELVDASIERIDAAGVVTAAGRHDLDVLIYATGFDVWDTSLAATIVNADGATLEDAIGEAPAAWMGLAYPGFPNFFTLLGPNTGLGHNSVVLMAEAQADYIARLIRAAARAGRPSLAIRQDVADAYNAGVQQRMQARVWVKGGCVSWYQHADMTIRSLWPDSVSAWRRALRRVELGDYDST